MKEPDQVEQFQNCQLHCIWEHGQRLLFGTFGGASDRTQIGLSILLQGQTRLS
jgi:hypothetical protein